MADSFGNIGAGRKVVAAAGTAEKLVAVRTRAARVVISALTTNTGVVAIGGSTAKAVAGAEVGVVMKNTSTPLELFQEDLNTIFVDASVNGEGVTFTYES